MSHRYLIVLPDDTINPIRKAIAEARHSLRIKKFIFSEPAMIEEVIAAKKRGLRVRVMLNPSRSNGDGLNEKTMAMLEEAGVEVKTSNPAYKVSHEKSMVVDDHMAFVQSLNWAPRNLK